MTSSTEYSKRPEERPLTELSLYHVWKGNVLLPSTNKLIPFDKISYKLDVKIQIQLGNLVIYQVQLISLKASKKTRTGCYQIRPPLNRPQKLQMNYYAWKMGVLRSQWFSFSHNGENGFSWEPFWIYYLGNPSNFFTLLFALLFTFSLFMHNFLSTTNVKPILSAVWTIFGRLSVLKLILLAVSHFYVLDMYIKLGLD